MMNIYVVNSKLFIDILVSVETVAEDIMIFVVPSDKDGSTVKRSHR